MTQSNLDGPVERHHFVFAATLHLRSQHDMRALRLLLFPSVALFIAACANPRSEAAVANALNDAANEIGGLKNDIAQLQTDLDSLRNVVARQDSTITRIVAGMPR
jgi:septal ring factor EnvC (AmiA/AmiB activator)